MRNHDILTLGAKRAKPRCPVGSEFGASERFRVRGCWDKGEKGTLNPKPYTLVAVALSSLNWASSLASWGAS